MQKQPLVLQPRVSPLINNFLYRHVVDPIMRACGSPVNILFPQAIADNIKSFKDVLASHRLTGTLAFAHKANQSDSLLKQMAVSDVHCDVASLNELRHALACGFAGNRLVATGPKNVDFLHLCLMHNVVINVDSVQELKDISTIKYAFGSKDKVRILLRLSNFVDATGNRVGKESRFGIPAKDIEHILEWHINKDRLELIGFAFHLDSTSIEERIVALETCIDAYDHAMSKGFQPQIINIGGGFGINYLEQEEQWNHYVTALKEAVLGNGTEMTWNNTFFGLSSEAGLLRGSLNTYSYFNPLAGSAYLNELLNRPLPGHQLKTVGSFLRSNEIQLWLEPGRALLDLAGLTLARVNSIKGQHENIVGLDMKRQDIAFLDQEIFVDPLFLPARSSPASSGSKGYYLAGNLCLESDLIFRRKLFLRVPPRKGDLFAFINTAAYMMDFSATNSIMQPTARRVAFVESRDGTNNHNWMLDEEYSPVWNLH